jgi:hypothetical protein
VRDRGTLNGVDLVAQRVRVNCGTIVRADVDIDSDDLASAVFGIEPAAGFDRITLVEQHQH